MKLKDEYIKLNSEQRLYQLQQPLIALTGGIASGKSSVAKIFAEHGLKIINADELVKKIYSSTDAIQFIKQCAPDVVDNNIINFPALRKKVFSDPALKDSIETFIYTRLPETFKSQVTPQDEVIIYDVPLLFERKLEKYFDIIVVVYSPRALQLQRLIKRDQNSRELAEKILDQQIDIEEKRSKADFVIDNSRDREELILQSEQLLNRLFNY